VRRKKMENIKKLGKEESKDTWQEVRRKKTIG
jgi:hypothetical protein